MALGTDHVRVRSTDLRGTVVDSIRSPAAVALTALHLGTREVEPNIKGVGIVWPYTGDPDNNAVATMRFKVAGEPNSDWAAGVGGWRYHVDDGKAGKMWRSLLAPISYKAFHGSILDADPGKTYDVEITVSDPGAGAETQSFRVTTRADVNTEAAVTYTHYVDQATGNDKNTGLTAATAWRTLRKAWSPATGAPGGARVCVAPGYYVVPDRPRTTPIQLFAQYRAVSYNATTQTWSIINPGKHTVLIPGTADGTQPGVSAPAGTSAGAGYVTDSRGPGLGNWELVTFSKHQVWRWTGSPIPDASTMMASTTRDGVQMRVAHWNADTNLLATPAGWAEVLRTNLTYNFGNYAPSGGSDVYVRLPGDVNPNTVWITMSARNQAGFNLNAPDCRVSGFEIRGFHYGVLVGSTSATVNADRAIIDHCRFEGNYAGVALQGRNAATDQYAQHHVIEKCDFADSRLWATDGSAIPWKFVKQSIVLATGTAYVQTRVGGDCESNAVYGRGWARSITCRWNQVSGCFNGFSMGDCSGYDRHSLENSDFYENEVRNCADDPFEPDYACINVRFFRNRTSNTFTFLSIGPGNYGPIYVWGNRIHQISSQGVKLSYQETTPYSCFAIKYSQKNFEGSQDVSPVRVYFVNNTIWSDWPTSDFCSRADAGGLTGNDMSRLWLRNNLVRTGRYAGIVRSASGWDEDYNHFSTSDTGRGLQFPEVQADGLTGVSPSQVFKSNVAAYRADYATRTGRPSPSHTNVAGDFITASVVDRVLESPATGDLRLRTGAIFRGAGAGIGNLTDTLGRLANLGFVP